MRDPALAPAHVLYYGVLYADRRPAPCARGGGDDSELYTAADQPRAAARIVLGARSGGGSLLFGPAPGAGSSALTFGAGV